MSPPREPTRRPPPPDPEDRRPALAEERNLKELPELPYFRWGIGAGALGALVIAAFFAVADVLAAEPFATPLRLGGTLFRDDPAPQEPFAVRAAIVSRTRWCTAPSSSGWPPSPARCC